LSYVHLNDFVERAACAGKYRHIVLSIAQFVKITLPPSIELDDLIGEGELALWEATAKFDVRRASTFEAYVRLRVRGAMIDSIKGKQYREATHEELPKLSLVPCRRQTVEQTLIEREMEDVRANELRNKFHVVERAIADGDQKYYPLSRKQKRVLALRYDRRERTQKQAGTAMRITQQASQELEHRAIDNLKRKLGVGA